MMRRDVKRSSNERNPSPSSKSEPLVRQRSSAVPADRSDDCCSVPDQIVFLSSGSEGIKSPRSSAFTTSTVKRRRTSCLTRLLRMTWLCFGVYGVGMMLIKLVHLTSNYDSTFTSNSLRKTVAMGASHDAPSMTEKYFSASQLAAPPVTQEKTELPSDDSKWEEKQDDPQSANEEVAEEGDTERKKEDSPEQKQEKAEPEQNQEEAKKEDWKPKQEEATPDWKKEQSTKTEAWKSEKDQNSAKDQETNTKVSKPAISKPSKAETKAETKSNTNEKPAKVEPVKRTKKVQKKELPPGALKELPNVLLVGAQKSGTTAVASFLFHHENVCKPQSPKDGSPIKEVHFFDFYDTMHSKGLQHYKAHFKHCVKDSNKTAVLDATPDYLPYAKRVAATYTKAGKEVKDNVKIIIILREPVDREFSWYHHMASESVSNPNPRPYTEVVLDDKTKKLLQFEQYVPNVLLPTLESSYSLYSNWITEWMDYFDRKQIIVLSYDELSNDPNSLKARLSKFLEFPSRPETEPQEIVRLNERAKSRKSATPKCDSHSKLAEIFDPFNQELYSFLEKHPGPEAEQRPFPKFQFKHCGNQSNGRVQKLRNSKEPSNTDWSRAPSTVYFATHHKTGTDISRKVASVLHNQGLVHYSEAPWNEHNLFRNPQGDATTCPGTTDKPEIRSYNHWPKWMIDVSWSKCLGGWWDGWPKYGRKVLLKNCITQEVDTLRKQLKFASCEKDYLVVHFVRNPVDTILSSYRYTKMGMEDWMHEKVGDHKLFKPEYCGSYENCKDMTIHEAVRDLPPDIGMQLEMNLVGMEIIKQMMVGSAMAKLDPEHHMTVSLTDIMESSTRFKQTWSRVVQGIFPAKKADSVDKLVGMLKQFDMNANPDTFAGKSHTTITSISPEQLEEDIKRVLGFEQVQWMMADPILQGLLR